MEQFLLTYISRPIDRLVDFIGRSVSWLTVAMTLIICGDVIMRYLFNSTKTWIIELEWHLFAIVFLIGASYTLLHDKHVRVDVFYERFSRKTKNRVNIFGLLLFLIPWSIVMIYYGYDYAINSFSFRESSPQPNGLPARYIIKSFISIGFILLMLQGISEVIKYSFSKK